jgi:glutamate-1-semialdehyde aminotransferase
MRKGQELYKKAKTLIPGGTMLLSKRPEMFLPDNWPSYFSKAKGCKIWDLDNQELLDMTIMGIGTNTLGYGHDAVDSAVLDTVRKGNMSTLSCPEEVYLAEKLIEINPWAHMVRFARSGGEANSIAIRIARAASGKDKVAICGYHGWHDWYLSANHNSGDSLSGHLLPGLNPSGVPKALKDTVFPFHYNNYEELIELVEKHDIGVIKMEVLRNFGPEDIFLHKVRELATKKNIVLIFDECTSGFRQTFGGLHKLYGVEPDMAMFGKALGNGYAITAILGKDSIMDSASKSFISSTFWTERIGPTAALKTLEIMEKIRSWEKITDIGKNFIKIWKKISKKNSLNIKIEGIPSLAKFFFEKDHLVLKTLLTQEFLKYNILGTNSIYACTSHDEGALKKYEYFLDKIFYKISNIYRDGNDPREYLIGEESYAPFSRLN